MTDWSQISQEIRTRELLQLPRPLPPLETLAAPLIQQLLQFGTGKCFDSVKLKKSQ